LAVAYSIRLLRPHTGGRSIRGRISLMVLNCPVAEFIVPQIVGMLAVVNG